MADDPKLVKAISPAQSRAARGLLGWSQSQLGAAAGLSLPTVKRFETGAAAVSGDALARLRSALEEAGAQFIDENGGGAGVRNRWLSMDSAPRDGSQVLLAWDRPERRYSLDQIGIGYFADGAWKLKVGTAPSSPPSRWRRTEPEHG